ncbi:protein-glutamate methylesterase/protein-glutamine glutaminase [Papillibacter cinnamivorans]|uniref:Protein-glutamate methylesterase/protein-glutamine glutaminase n=1 Tax=Papillibacter cinnamivorans DSM 12816 TaxID=1122930 RepID=A0A1W1YJD7_9FIRM|nr:chemotaxis response regulator protein-glutamate methylesterase [Papillibacter cinnamivorans]SMC35858.1 two-component system, chemotaxis family, response regulator CheB [Papillibacter cinnamivorans DSM 12816]
MDKKIRVLVVDDSLMYREFLRRKLSADPGVEVVATAVDPYDARDKIVEFMPDVMTLDVEMPKMNGIEFLRKLMPQYPLPVIVLSGANASVFDALNAGAVDFVAKTDMNPGGGLDHFVNDLILKIKTASTANLSQWGKPALKTVSGGRPFRKNKIIAIGASTGGTEALLSVLKALPGDMPGIVVVQHMPPVFTKLFAQRLDNTVALHVKEAQTGDAVVQGSVLIAPGNNHMVLERSGSGYRVRCFEGEKVNGHCPSADVLFHSVAQTAKGDALGVILTGMGGDGAKGLLEMRVNGARTIGQDEKSCVVYGMPKVAFQLGAVEKQASLGDIPEEICSLLAEQ